MPTVTVDVDVDLDDYEDDDLIEEIERRGYAVTKMAAGLADLDHVEHLVICGQLDAAKAEALQLVGKAIGRRLQ